MLGIEDTSLKIDTHKSNRRNTFHNIFLRKILRIHKELPD
jgi:hypothetical protein